MEIQYEEFFLHAVFLASQTITILWSSTECYYKKRVHDAIKSNSQIPPIPQLIDNNGLYQESCLVFTGSVFCPSMIIHQISVLVLYVILSYDYYLITRMVLEEYLRIARKIEIIEGITLTIFWISLSVYSIYYMAEFLQVYTDVFIPPAENPDCILSSFSFFITSFYFAFYILVVILVIAAGAYAAYTKYRIRYIERKKYREMEDKLLEILERVYSNDDEIEKFYSENRELLMNYPIFDVELRVFKDQFEKDFEICSNQNYNQCAICLDNEYERDEKVVQFPGCHHAFHHQCLMEWIKKSFDCPICKRKFRDGFAFDMAMKMRSSFMRESEHRQLDGRIN